MTRPPPRSTLFPYTTLFRSRVERRTRLAAKQCHCLLVRPRRAVDALRDQRVVDVAGREDPRVEIDLDTRIDRKSTRLNSSHVSISYAVFCLKKKKQIKKHNS